MRTHYNQWCCLHQMHDTTRQISHSKLPRPIYDILTQMSCRRTQPVVLQRGVRFRHGSLLCVNSSSAARALCGIGITAYVATFLVNIFHLPMSRSYLASLEKASPIHTCDLTSREFVITWTWRHLYKRGWVTWMEMIPDRRFSIWFLNKVHRSSRNKYAECRINCVSLRSNLPI